MQTEKHANESEGEKCGIKDDFKDAALNNWRLLLRWKH